MPNTQAAIADQLLLGRYRLIEERGKGGFGTVSVCWDPRLMRRVAIKTIPLHRAHPTPAPPVPQKRRRDLPFQGGAAGQDVLPGMPSPQVEAILEQRRRDMLLRAALAETRTASMLAHPNIVAMLDFEYDEHYAYIIMEYVEGASLAELLDATEDGLLTADEAAAVVESVCDALQFAHDNGVLHLDIKPDNILIDMSGRVKLADFGMAALSSATGQTAARGGTVGYMPPEQISCGDVDVRTDVFAFASVMYEALTGLRPFAAATLEQSRELVERGVPDPCALNESVDPATADALMASLDPQPAVRPRCAEDLADELLPGLGKPKAGRKSLAAFVADVLDDSQPDPDPASETPGASSPYAWRERDGDADLGPLSAALPNLAPRLLRALGAASSGSVAGTAVQALAGGAGPAAPLVAFFAVLGLGLAAPPLGYALALVALALACAVRGFWLYALAALAAGAAWWVLVARGRPLAAAPTMAGAMAAPGSNPLSALLAGWLLSPGQAALSGLAAFAVCAGVACLAHAGAPDLGAAGLGGFTAQGAPLNPVRFWLTAVQWVGAAALAGLLCHSGGKTRSYMGCLAAGIVATAFQLVITRVENAGSWSSLAPEVLLFAAGSTILTGMCVFMFGTPRALAVDGAQPNDCMDSTREGA